MHDRFSTGVNEDSFLAKTEVSYLYGYEEIQEFDKYLQWKYPKPTIGWFYAYKREVSNDPDSPGNIIIHCVESSFQNAEHVGSLTQVRTDKISYRRACRTDKLDLFLSDFWMDCFQFRQMPYAWAFCFGTNPKPI